MKLFVFFIISVIYTADSQNHDCNTPNGTPGNCMVIQKCSPIYNLVKKQGGVRSYQVQQYLQRSFCGFEGSYAKTCCPQLTSSKTKVNQVNQQDPWSLMPDKCGSELADRIVGGEIMALDEFPWLALLEYESPKGTSNGCGGVLISKRYVLTAAHCVSSIPSNWRLKRVRLGEYNVQTNPDCLPDGDGTDMCAPPVVVVPIERQIPHEKYGRPKSYSNDIALLRLARNVSFTNYVKPICLPTTPDLGQSYWSAGWGQTEWKGSSATKLKVSLPLSDHNSCKSLYASKRVFIGDEQICAGGRAGKDTCKGDSGGPLMRQVRRGYSNHWVVDGVVSLGHSPCGVPGWPAVYTKVHSHLNWILGNIKP